MTDLPRTAACPSCGAALRPDAPWCTLCYADLRPKPAPEPPPPPPLLPDLPPATAAYGTPGGDPLTQPLMDLLLPGPAPAAAGAVPSWPCGLCQATNPMTETHCGTCGKAFLAAVQESEAPLLVLPLVGDLGRLSRAQRLGLAFAAVAALLIPLALITLLLTDRPPATEPTTILPSDAVVTEVTPSP